MNYKLLVLDIDGTATNTKKEVTPKTKEAVIRLQENGIPVAIASGRPIPGVGYIADEFSFADYGSYALCYNGAKIINWQTKEIIYNKTIPLSLPKKLYQDACEYDVGIISYLPDDSHIICGRRTDRYIDLESRVCRMPLEMCDNFPELISFPVTKCIIKKYQIIPSSTQ